jgi:transcriptional regulator with XRE-family HTH domain
LNDPATRQALRRELGGFLRTRREQADPATYGIAAGSRRRTKGLRREELAHLVDVGITWYTWLEQGRDVQPSFALLERLAEALHLSAGDRRHLIEISQSVRDRQAKFPSPSDAVLQRVVDGFADGPAFVRNRRYDVVVLNRQFAELFDIKGTATGLARNILWAIFTNPRLRLVHHQWEEVALNMLGGFRSAYGKRGGDPDFQELVRALTAASPFFAERWNRYHVWAPTSHQTVLSLSPDAAGGGLPVELDVSYFDVVGDDDRLLVVMTPRATPC